MTMKKMNKLFVAILTGIAIVVSGCDSIPEVQDTETAAMFTGTWVMVSLCDDEGCTNPSADDTLARIEFKFRVNFSFELNIEYDDDREDQKLTGSYLLQKDSFIIELNSSVEGVGKVPLNFAYEFRGEGAPEGGPNQLFLITEGETVNSLNLIFGSDLAGVVAQEYLIESRLT